MLNPSRPVTASTGCVRLELAPMSMWSVSQTETTLSSASLKVEPLLLLLLLTFIWRELEKMQQKRQVNCYSLQLLS